jgi:hypothetical protein
MGYEILYDNQEAGQPVIIAQHHMNSAPLEKLLFSSSRPAGGQV